MTLTLRAGQVARFLVDMTDATPASAAPFGAVEVPGHGPVDMTTDAETGDLLVNPLPPGIYHFEIRSGKYTIADGHLDILESPLENHLGEASFTVKAAVAPELAQITLNIPKGEPGMSALEYAREQGYEGTEAQWLGDAAAIYNARTAAETAATSAGTSAETAATKASEASTSASTAATKAGEAATSAGTASTKASEAASSATEANASKEAAATSASTATTKAGEASASASSAATKAGEASTSASTAATKAGEAATSAAEANTSKEAAEAARARAEEVTGADQAALAALHAAEARRTRAEMMEEQSDMLAHIDDTTHHITATEHVHLQRLIATFPDIGPDTPSTPEPPLPDEAVSLERVAEYFATNAQPGVTQAPAEVFASRVPWARFDSSSNAWQNNASAVNEQVFGVSRKLFDNAELVHVCSTDTVEGQDDYVGKRWAFFWARGNYVTDAHGVKHVTAIEGQSINGRTFDPSKPVCTFGPAFWFFCKVELWQDPATGHYTTDDGTATGTPLFQLWGISARAWGDLNESRREELTAHGITEADFHLWPSAQRWDENEGKLIPRNYYCHAAYCGCFEEDETGAARITSKPNLPLYNNLSHNTLNALYGNAAGMGGSASVNGFGMLFDIVKGATKNSQSLHSGMSNNNQSAIKASQSTGVADYLFPVASKGNFEVGGTVWLWQTASGSTATTYRRSITVQIGRIDAIETRSLVLADGTSATSLCLVIDPSTVEPFLTRTGADNAAAIAATKELTDAGQYACCFATQGMALSGETDAVIGKHDGARASLTNGRHSYRVQGTEFMPGAWICAADTVAIKGNGSTDVEIDGVVSIPTSSQYIVLQAPCNVARRTSGSLANYLAGGYVPVGIATGTAGYILNEQLSSTGVAYPVAAGGTGSSDNTGHADNYWVGANPAEFLSGGNLYYGSGAGSAVLYLAVGLGYAAWDIGGRD